MAEIRSISGGKKTPCVYCGGDPHPVPLACPRIAEIHIDTETGCVNGLTFWGDYFNEGETPEPPDAA